MGGRGILGLRGLCRGDQGAEGGSVAIGQIRKKLAIQLTSSLLQSVHETAVGNIGGAAGGSDAHDPQAAEIALLEAPAFVAVAQRLLYRLLGGWVQFALGEEKPLGKGQGPAPAIAALTSTLSSRHVFSPF